MKILKIIIVCIAILPILPWLIYGLGFMLLPRPPSTKNTYGEFPFRIVYEIAGEQVEIEDVLICEFAGRGYATKGKALIWNERLENDESDERLIRYLNLYRGLGNWDWQWACVIKLHDGIEIGRSGGSIYLDIGTSPYYLGYNIKEGYKPGTVLSANNVINEEDLFEKYEIKIIELVFSEPMIGNGIKLP